MYFRENRFFTHLSLKAQIVWDISLVMIFQKSIKLPVFTLFYSKNSSEKETSIAQFVFKQHSIDMPFK